MQNHHLRFVQCRNGQVYDGDLAKLQGIFVTIHRVSEVLLIRMKLVFVIRTLPFAVLDFIAGLHSMNMDKMFPNSPNMPMIGITTPRITNVRTDPEIYDIFSQKFLKIFINLIYYLICLPSLLIIADTSLVAKNPQDLFNLEA